MTASNYNNISTVASAKKVCCILANLMIHHGLDNQSSKSRSCGYDKFGSCWHDNLSSLCLDFGNCGRAVEKSASSGMTLAAREEYQGQRSESRLTVDNEVTHGIVCCVI